MTWLLTGGAGYIGSHIVRAFQQAERPVVVLDDLSTGSRDLVPAGVPLVEASVLDTDAVRAALKDHAVTGVVHLAAKKAVAESVERPLHYWAQNVDGLRSLLQACTEVGIARVLYSSSAAVYGTPPTERVTEDSPTAPVSPYGTTKLAGEWMLREVAAAHGLHWAALRYFNVAGAGAVELGDRSVSNLVPLVLQAVTAGRPPQVYGADYPTRDGSCVRDYIHVVDLAEAHVAAVRRLEAGPLAEVYNVGRGEGVTVKEVMAAVGAAVGREVTYDVVGRRAGDPAAYFADPSKIAEQLGWRARLGLADMVGSAWAAWAHRHPSPLR